MPTPARYTQAKAQHASQPNPFPPARIRQHYQAPESIYLPSKLLITLMRILKERLALLFAPDCVDFMHHAILLSLRTIESMHGKRSIVFLEDLLASSDICPERPVALVGIFVHVAGLQEDEVRADVVAVHDVDDSLNIFLYGGRGGYEGSCGFERVEVGEDITTIGEGLGEGGDGKRGNRAHGVDFEVVGMDLGCDCVLDIG